ncbi:hypothetical protein KGQ20_45155 [Catenulispora sp. NF23]|uniref:G1 family glutamic endopeptidase n=1 Tax=Catenulispora pinistramenti TaxID=2705254 RepID=UPI001BA80C37|nr:G1 family glutamic endopeptidase [Catenulispora pinistramenti]MBS2539954.1 hypothetical protein [Catenulispora pinistramenti]
MRISGYRAGLAALAAGSSLVLAAALAGPAAATTGAHTKSPASFPHYNHVFNHARHADQIWGGYADTGTQFTSISGSWTVPTLDCSSTPDSSVSPWIGIDGFNSSTVEQIGFDQDCQGGQAGYYPWVEMYPADSDYFTETVNAGDQITASVSVSGSAWTLTESDTTQGWSKTFNETGDDQLSSAEAIVEDLGDGIQPVAPFGSITFNNLTANGQPLSDAGTPNSTDIERGDTPLTQNSPLSGGSFTLSWLQS